MSFRTSLIVLNAVALVVVASVIVWRVFSLKRNPEHEPANLGGLFEDDALEGRHLERALGWSLVWVLVLAISLPLYFLVEPNRQADADDAFLERSIERGSVLFANSQSEHYDATVSLLCADCHGVDGLGGSAPYVLQPEADKCLVEANQGNPDVPECLPQQVVWEAPALTLAPLRYDREQLRSIIIYGRPGTPMPAWGVVSGKGVLNDQGIEDLVNYIESIQVTSAEAKAAAESAVDDYRAAAKDMVDLAKTTLDDARTAVTDAQAALAELQANPEATEDEITAAQDEIALAEEAIPVAEADLAIARVYRDEIKALTDGAILFRLNCARCHTKGWSYHVTEPTRQDLPQLPAQGSGAYGPNLRDGSTLLQFPGEAGTQQQFNWIALGVPANQAYGVRGISSGRMPHFGQVLSTAQIEAIVEYERSL